MVLSNEVWPMKQEIEMVYFNTWLHGSMDKMASAVEEEPYLAKGL